MADWGCRVKLGGLSDLTKFAESIRREIVQPAVTDAAFFVRDELIRSIESGRTEWPQLREITKWMKIREGKDPRVLVGKSDFKNAIQVEVGVGKATVGMLMPKGSAGQDMEMIARVLEGGAVIPVTVKMRKWFAARGMNLKKSTTLLRIPERPLFNPSMTVLEDKLDELLDKYFKKMAGG